MMPMDSVLVEILLTVYPNMNCNSGNGIQEASSIIS